MKLDKDIHTKLVNPQPSTTLEKNVKNVLVALNAKAPYDKLIKMIETIKIWMINLIQYDNVIDWAECSSIWKKKYGMGSEMKIDLVEFWRWSKSMRWRE